MMADSGQPKPKKDKKEYGEHEVISIMKKEKDRASLEVTCRKSDYENRFKRVYIDSGPTNYVVCQDCDDNKLMKYVQGGGTARLLDHNKKFHKSFATSSTQSKIPQFVKNKVSPKDKSMIADKLAICCAKELRPFYMVEGEGFIDFCQALIDLGASKGSMDAKELLPCADTVRNHLKDINGAIKSNLIEHLKAIESVNCTADHWTNKYLQERYMTITIHYLDVRNTKIKMRILGTFGVDDMKAKTTSNEFDSKMKEFGLEAKIRLITTDNCSAMKAAFEDSGFDISKFIDWIGCSAHNLSLVQKYALSVFEDGKDPISSITTLIKNCKSIVTTVKKCGNNKTLDHRLKQEVDTRWDSHYDMLKSVLTSIDELAMIESISKEYKHINRRLLTDLVDLLKPVKAIREILCKDDEISFNLVVISHDKLCKIMKRQESDSVPIMVLKNRFTRFIKEKFTITRYHMIATYLTPSFRHVAVNWPDTDLVQKSMDLLKVLLEVEPESDMDDYSENENVEDHNRPLFADYYGTVKVAKIDSEFDHYKRREFVPSEIKICPFVFWSESKSSYPKLSAIAYWLLSAPATNVSSERSFSAAGNTITTHRNSLLSDTVDELLFCRSNLDMLDN